MIARRKKEGGALLYGCRAVPPPQLNLVQNYLLTQFNLQTRIYMVNIITKQSSALSRTD